MIYLWILLTILSGLCYRFGGMPRPFRTWMRDWLIPVLGLAVMLFLVKIDAPWYIHLVGVLLTGAACSTYWDFLFKFDNHWFHCFMLGLAYVPYTIYTGDWMELTRPFIMAIIGGAISQISKNDWVEELSRGAVIVGTMPIFYL